MKEYNRVYAKIDLDAITYNMEQMKERIGDGAQMIAVIKSDGYGHGSVPIAELFENTDYVWGYATACFDEAEVLRNARIKKKILVLGCVFPDQYEELLRKEIRPTVYMKETAEELSKLAASMSKTAWIHIKIDTGMGRIGFPVSEKSADEIAAIAKLPNIKIEGMFTHFAKADEIDKSFTKMQHEKFLQMIGMLKERGVEIPFLHCDNSAGIIDFPDMKHDVVRAGISLYGLYPSEEVDQNAIPLKPAMELISHVTFVKEVEAGTPISYGGTYITPKRMKIATVPVGYGDGYSRKLSNISEVLIHGKRAKIVGRVCMDQFMVDVTEIEDVKFMDQVTLIGCDGDECITVEELSDKCGRFNYEFICCLSKRIPRVYTKNGEIVRQMDYFSRTKTYYLTKYAED